MNNDTFNVEKANEQLVEDEKITESTVEEIRDSNDTNEDSYVYCTSDRGFKCKIEKDALEDVEMYDDLVALENGDVTRLTKVVLSLLGESQKEEFFDFLRNDKGRVIYSTLSTELISIFQNANNVLKNS